MTMLELEELEEIVDIKRSSLDKDYDKPTSHQDILSLVTCSLFPRRLTKLSEWDSK